MIAPGVCPVCETPVEREPEEVALRCPNPACPAVVAARLRHFVSRGAMEIDGLGDRLLAQLVDAGMVTDEASLWDLDIDVVAELPGWGETSATNLHRELDEARTRPLHRLLFALGIPHVGERAARLLAQRFGSLEELASADRRGRTGHCQFGGWMVCRCRAPEYDETPGRTGNRSPPETGG